jgi:general secretion pathway protein A
LTLDETRGYIAERLRIAGNDGEEIFSPEAIQAIHQYSRGIQRVTNLLSEHALISAFVDQRNPVPAECVEEIARDFGLHEIDPLAQSLPHPPSNGANGDNPPLVESLLQALNALVDRLNKVESPGSGEPDHGDKL